MMTIPLKRREYLRATHLLRSFTLFLGDGGRIEIVSSFAPQVRYATIATNQNRAQRPFCFLTNQTKVQILDYGQTTGKVNVSSVLFSPSPLKKRRTPDQLQE